MAIQAAPSVVEKKSTPVSESANVSDKTLQEFNSAYNAFNIDKSNEEGEKNNGKQLKEASQDKTLDTDAEASVLFTLLNNSRFKEFIKLALGGDGEKLKLIIKKNRAKRGVNHKKPISNGFKVNKPFLNRIGKEYKNVGWLMEGRPGQTLNLVW